MISKHKNLLSFFTMFTLVILSVAFSAGIVSAADLSIDSIVIPSDTDHDAGSFDITFNLNNDDVESNLDWAESMVSEGTGTISFDQDFIGDGQGDTVTIMVTATISFPSNQEGNIGGTIKVIPDSGGDEPEFTFSVSINEEELSIEFFDVPTITQNGTLELKNTGDVTLTDITFTTSGNIDIEFTPSSITSLIAGQISDTINLMIINLENLKFGLNPTTITATSDEGAFIKTSSFNVQKTFCSNGQVGGDLELRDIDVDNLDGSNDKWEIFDEIEIKVEVKNNGPEDIDDVFVELGFFDSSGDGFEDDFDWDTSDEEEVDLGTIRDDKKKTATFRFTIPAEFADFGASDYRLAIKAYSDDLGESVECIDESDDLSDDFFDDIEMELEDDEDKFVVVENIKIDSPQVTCGETVSGQFTVFNIGDEDQEDQVLVIMRNTALDLYEEFEFVGDLDVGEDKTRSFSFTVPNNVEDGLYVLDFTTFYEYDNDDDTYDRDSDATFKGFFDVIGCTVVGGGVGPTITGDVIITATLASDAVAGQELIVSSTITNTGDETATFIIDAKGYESWADSVSISERILNLNPGESATTSFTFQVNEDASGSESFLIETTSNGQVELQEVEVNIESSAVADADGFNLRGNNLIWVIAIINIILIVLIILVAVRLSRN